MWDGDLTYNDFLQRLSIQDVLRDAGYHLNKLMGCAIHHMCGQTVTEGVCMGINFW